MDPGLVVTAVPSNDIVIAELAEKWLPETVTVVPAGPVEGLNDIAVVLYTAVSAMFVLIDTDLGLSGSPVSCQ